LTKKKKEMGEKDAKVHFAERLPEGTLPDYREGRRGVMFPVREKGN